MDGINCTAKEAAIYAKRTEIAAIPDFVFRDCHCCISLYPGCHYGSESCPYCGGFSEPPRKVIYGGPMMGMALTDLSSPVLKQNNAILAFGRKEATPPKSTACIRCGRCVSHCPFGLSSCDISKAFASGDGAALEKTKVNLCMECGCCSYVCPAKRDLVQRNKLAKAMLRDYQSKKGGTK